MSARVVIEPVGAVARDKKGPGGHRPKTGGRPRSESSFKKMRNRIMGLKGHAGEAQPVQQSQPSPLQVEASGGNALADEGASAKDVLDAKEVVDLALRYSNQQLSPSEFLAAVRSIVSPSQSQPQQPTQGHTIVSKPVPQPPVDPAPRANASLGQPKPASAQHRRSPSPTPPKVTIAAVPKSTAARQQRQWTKEEDQALIEGVKQHGEGKWNKILLADGKSNRLLVSKPLVEVQRRWKELKAAGVDPQEAPKPSHLVVRPTPIRPAIKTPPAAAPEAVPAAEEARSDRRSSNSNGSPLGGSPQRQSPAAAASPHSVEKESTGSRLSIMSIPEDEELGPYEDPDFTCTPNSLFEDDPSRIDPKLKWLRPNEYTDNPTLFVGGVEAGDVCQGDLGDCWFLSALSCVGNDPSLIPKLFTTKQLQPGRYDLRFFKNGRWRPVHIDDRIPCVPDPEGGGWKPAFGRGQDKNEIWVPLIEKAYAKLHGCYEHLEGGRISQALADLTGGTCEKLFFDEPGLILKVQSGELWERFKTILSKNALMGCGYGDTDAAVEGDQGNGILANHAYGVIGFAEAEGFHLLKCRNPWGRAGEWTGAWSDKSDMWSKHPEVAKQLGYEDRNDGIFWIAFEDFFANFNECYICHMFDEALYKSISYGDMFYEETDGGCPLMGRRYAPTWRSNPQYLLNTSPNEPTTVFLHMSQPDSRLDSGEIQYHLAIGFVVVKGKKLEGIERFDKYPRRLEFIAKEEIVANCKPLPHRFCSLEVELPPIGDIPFYIIPYNIKQEEDGLVSLFPDGRFLFDLYSTDKTIEFAEVEQATDYLIYQLQGELTPANSHGQWKNPTWGQNPQFSFRSKDKKPRVSLVLHGDKELEHLGLTFFRDPEGKKKLDAFAPSQLIGYAQFAPIEVSVLHMDIEANSNYVIGACTYKPGTQGKFTVLVFSTEELEFDGEVKLQEAGRMADRLPKSKRKYPLPMGYASEIPKVIRGDKARSRFVVRRTSQGEFV